MSEQQPVNVGAPSERRGRFKEILSNRFGWNRSKTSESQLGISTLTTGEINFENIVISPQLQQSNFDCGQTVLDMLGYDGHQLFPDKEVTSEQLRKIPGAIELTTPVGNEEELDYTIPKVWIILGKDKVAGAQHWVIRHKNKIYCPTLGEVKLEEYKKRYVGFVLQTFDIPLAGQRGHNNS